MRNGMNEPETWVIPVTLGADQASRFHFEEPERVDPFDPCNWLASVRQRLVDAFCVVTDTDVLGPYVTWEEAQSVLDEGCAGDVFRMTYQ